MKTKDKIEYLANYLTELTTNGECCLPDLIPYSRALMIGKAEELLKKLEEL